MIKRRAARLLFFVLALAVLAASAGLSAMAADRPAYYYFLRVSDYTKQADGQWKMSLELYVFNKVSGSPQLGGGSFGLRFPERLGGGSFLGFTPADSNISLSAYDGNYGAGSDQLTQPRYHFFTWTRTPGAAYELQLESGKRQDVPGPGDTVTDISAVPGGVRMYLGKYEFLLGQEYPTKGSVGAMNWLKTELSKDPLYTSAGADGGTLNDEIWFDSDSDGVSAYQGHYPGGLEESGEVVMEQADLKLQFTEPKEWPAGITVLSYDPNKAMTMALYRATTAPDAAEQSYEESPLMTLALDTAAGVGRTDQTADLGLFEQKAQAGEITDERFYKVVFSKPGHVSYTVEDLYLPKGESLSSLTLGDEQPYLPCGDLDGDGQIKLRDRSILLSYLNRRAAKQEPDPLATLADLNGDGVVTLADLNILMASENYNQSDVLFRAAGTDQ